MMRRLIDRFSATLRTGLGVAAALLWTASPLPAAPCPCQQTPTLGPVVQPGCPEYGPGAAGPTPAPMPRESESPPPAFSDNGLNPAPGSDDFPQSDPFDLPSASPQGDYGAVAAADSPSIHMIGDYFGNGYFLGDPGTMPGSLGHTASTPIAGGDRRYKVSDNLNPIPTDRVFFNYHHFHKAVYDINGIHRDVDRFTFGLERVFFDNLASLEVRIPFASGLDHTQTEESPDTITSEFGNVPLTLKLLLWERGDLRLTGGLATVLPTAADATVIDSTDAITVLENEAVHLQPFVGYSCGGRGRRFFSSGYVAVDVDVNGNPLSTGILLSGGSSTLSPVGDIRDQTMVFADWQIGYWCYQDYGHIGYLNGVAPVLELHYSQATEAPEVVPGAYENPFGRVSLLNMTAGLVFDFRSRAQVTVYSAAPLLRETTEFAGTTVSPTFATEVGVQCNYRY